jgi:hypothetical protein
VTLKFSVGLALLVTQQQVQLAEGAAAAAVVLVVLGPWVICDISQQ